MTSKTGTKKKEAGKTNVSQFLRSSDDEIKAELDAMTNLEYNLHSDYDGNDYIPDTPLFTVRKTRNPNLKESKHDKPATNTEKTTTKIDKFETDNQTQTYVPNASIEELQALVRQAAATAEDKYRILDARDRLMRAKQSKSQHISMTKVTRGVCPDMCPEKERLMRESQRQVASYELLECSEYRINHVTAVKQYSRSSADQEEPMPQDLRPVKSLIMTMSYLLHEIADLSEQNGTNLAEWYHFLWDRTRGIRKDITQQELCCHESVELVEQCARFHIVCAERLCAEEASVFDKKINTENLTKCLQTLKYMYHDLRVKGMACKNEPEFRAYIILLNLNNGNFMWDVQRLPAFVQKSPEVKFAIEVYSCIESNNYAKFFRLVRDTTYQNACILLRYFNQVRVKALSIMVKAYCRTTSTAFPLYELIDILGFEDENEAIYFCEQVGLNLSKDELHIMLNRQNFSQPMTNIEQGRACNYIEAKRIAMGHSIGLCIAGDSMPDKLYEDHEPHDSFDAQGYLKPEAINAEDQNIEKMYSGQDDPYEYMEEDVCDTPEIFRVPKAKKNIEPFGNNDNKKTEVPNVFKMPAVSPQSSSFHNAVLYGKRAASKTEVPSLFSTDSIFTVSSKAQDESMAEEKAASYSLPAVPLKRSREEDNSSGKATTSLPTSIFGNAPRTNIFAKSFGNNEKNFAESRQESTSSSTTSTSNIFGTSSQINIFANAQSVSANFENPLAKRESVKSTLKRPSEKSIFGKIDKSVKPKVPLQAIAKKTARERQEIEKKLELERRRLLEVEREKMLKKIDRETDEIFDQLRNEIIHDICKTIVRDEINRVKLYDNISENIIDELLSELIDEDCDDILNREINVQRKLDELSKRTQNRIIMKYYRMWGQYARRKRQQRSALDVTPVWLQKRSVEECAKSLYRKDQELAISNMRRKRLKIDCEEPQYDYLEPIESRIHDGIRENARILETNLSSVVYWKMIISWPNLDDRPTLWRHKKIMNQYMCPSDWIRMPIIKTYKPNSYETLHICIKHFEGMINDHELLGNDGLFFVAASSENPKYIVRRLTNTILSRQKLMPIPLFVVVIGDGNESPQKIRLQPEIDAFLESGYVSEYVIHYEDSINENIILKLIQDATTWLTVNKSPSVPLEMDYLSRVIDTCLTEELWLRIIGHSSYNEPLQIALKDVEFIIDLHNEAVTHLIDIIFDPESLMYTDFPTEFRIFLSKDTELPCSFEYVDTNWKREDEREGLERIINDFTLPKWTFGWPINDTLEFHKSVLRYCQQCLENSNYNHVSCAILSNAALNPNGNDEMSFVQVLLEILREKIRLIEPGAKVVYNKNHVRHFRNLPWWFKSTTLTSYNERKSVSRDSSLAPDESIISIEESLDDVEMQLDDEIDEIVKSYDVIHAEVDLVSSFCRKTREKATELREISDKLEKTLNEQKSRSLLLDEKLKLALGENEDIGIL